VEKPDYTSLAFVQLKGDRLEKDGYDWYDYAEVKLKAGQSITIQGIPEPSYGAFGAYTGFCYKVVEVSPDGYSTVVSRQNWDKGDKWDYDSNEGSTHSAVVGEHGPYVQSCIIRKNKNNGNWVRAGVTFTNTLTDRRTLTVTKQVEDDAGYQDDNSFEFEIRLYRMGTGAALSGDFPVEYLKDGVSTGTGTLNFEEKTDLSRGVATVSLKSGESIKIKNLPTDIGYQILERNAEKYETSIDYTSYAGTQTELTGTSAYNTVDGEYLPYISVGYPTGSGPLDLSTTFCNSVHALTLSKTVKGTSEEKQEDFTFRIQLTKGSSALSGTYAVESSATDDAIAPRYKSLTFDSTGTAEVALRHGQAITILGLPDGYSATAEEIDTDASHYTTNVKVDNQTETQNTKATLLTSGTTGHRHTIAFSNTSEKKRLSVTKVVDGNVNSNDLEQGFLFSVNLHTIDSAGAQIAIPNFSLEDNISFATTGFGVDPLTMDDVHLVQSSDRTFLWFYLKNGQTVNIDNLPSNTHYEIKEPESYLDGDTTVKQNADLAYYSSTASYTDSIEGQKTQELVKNYRWINADMPDESNDVVFTNTRTDTLTLKKTITENVNADTQFSFDITLKGTDGSAIANGTYGNVSVVNGKATVSLKGGESRTLTNLPAGTTYTIEETNAKTYNTTIQITGNDGTFDNSTKTVSGTVYGGTIVNFTNDKEEIKVPTGIRTDLRPAGTVLILALVFGLMLLISRRRVRK
jgi:hypothetical protein